MEGGSIFLGINTDNEVFGIGVNRSKRDMLRVALDRCMMDLVPSVMHSLYELIYFTVVGPEGIEKNMTGIPLPDRFVIGMFYCVFLHQELNPVKPMAAKTA